ncbi:MAG: DUF4282 domain-containing protein [Sulfobacillus sp.]|nr:DUF4282 domain-containing protein [Sulfobacillus sp.]
MSFPAITLYTKLSLVLSWIIAGLFAIGGIVTFASHIASGSAFIGFLGMIGVWVFGFFVWLWIRIIPEVLAILIKIEENTRRPS